MTAGSYSSPTLYGRELTIVVRDLDALPPYARQLVDYLKAIP
jgi:hypothetical protein